MLQCTLLHTYYLNTVITTILTSSSNSKHEFSKSSVKHQTRDHRQLRLHYVYLRFLIAVFYIMDQLRCVNLARISSKALASICVTNTDNYVGFRFHINKRTICDVDKTSFCQYQTDNESGNDHVIPCYISRALCKVIPAL